MVPGLKLHSATEGRCGFKEPCYPFDQAVAGVNNDSARENRSNPTICLASEYQNPRKGLIEIPR